MRYEFDWDPAKARRNQQKHGVSFERAARIFLDPFAISIFDESHSENEVLLVVVHTFRSVDAETSLVRLISARKATKEEAHQYHERR